VQVGEVDDEETARPQDPDEFGPPGVVLGAVGIEEQQVD